MNTERDSQFTQVTITDDFWKQYQDLVNDVVIPYQWKALNDELAETEPSHAIENFEIAAGVKQGEFYGMVFQDSDVAKWIEAVAYSLKSKPDPELEKMADDVIELIGQAQLDNGYVNTYFTVKDPKGRWTNLCECHELYCAGHLIEAAVAYYHATGKSALLNIVSKFVEHINDTFGEEPHKIKGYPGHPEIELALMRLYEITQDETHILLCRYFIEQRGKVQDPHFYDEEYEKRGKTSYFHEFGPAWIVEDKSHTQAHAPIKEQDKAIGHAVRVVYLLTGVAHLALLSQDEEKLKICQHLWHNIVHKQMYITGGIGAQKIGEAFTIDYDLPNDTAYTETCASIGLMMFANRMLQLESKGEYADVMERALYNNVISGMALDGKHFFYVNPLEVNPKFVPYNHIYEHIKPVRQRWFGCACCPPNVARILGALGNYIYTQKEDEVLVNLYVANKTELRLNSGSLAIEISGNYGWEGQSRVLIHKAPDKPVTLALRIPSWSKNTDIYINGNAVSEIPKNGYLYLTHQWQESDVITLEFDMEPAVIRSNPLVRHNSGKVAIQRGPFVYCMEEVDNGDNLAYTKMDVTKGFIPVKGDGIFDGKVLLKASGYYLPTEDAESQSLYQFNTEKPTFEPKEFTLIPYFTWANRGENEMRVWINEV